MAAPTPSLIDLVAVKLLNSDGKYIGTATLISPTLAVTAAHLVEDHQEYFIALTRHSEELQHFATVIARQVEQGLATIEFDPLDEVSLPPQFLSIEEPEPSATWDCLYFSTLNGTTSKIFGLFEGIETVQGFPRLKLKVLDSAPTSEVQFDFVSYPGLSGAPIIIDEQVVGMMAQDVSQDGYLHATPLTERLKNEIEEAKKSAEPAAQPMELDEAKFLGRLSPSSRSALAYAIGMSTGKLHMEMLIAGLFQKENGPTQNEFKRAGIDREKLDEIFSSAVEGFLPAAESITPQLGEVLPELSKHVRKALIAAVADADANQSTKIRSRHLIRGALAVKECSLIKALINEGVDREKILLDDEKPRTPRRPTQAGIRSDDPEGDDLLDIKAEVEALCAVLASRDVKPPISLGLFGEWGSGKSFFMKKMEARFNELKEVARKGDSAFCANIVQLWFNAWHYMDTNLWASLATQIFDELARELAKQDALAAGKDPDYERAQLVARRADATEAVTKASQAKHEADTRVRASQRQLENIQSGETTVAMSPQAVLREGYRFAIQQPEVRQTVVAAEDELNQKIEEAAQKLNMEDTPPAVKEQLLELHGLWGYLQATILAIRNTKQKWTLILLVAIFLILVSAIVWLLPMLLVQPWVQSTWVRILGVGVALLGTISPYIPAVNRAVKIVHDAIKSNQESIEKARLEAERKLQAEHEQLQETAKQADQALKQAVTQAQALTTELDELRSDRKMSNFIRQRQQSSDYTRYLGVIAKARNDFEQLSVLIAKEQERSAQVQQTQRQKKEEADSSPAEEPQLLLPRIDRIILYIDDLDRCPEDKVVDVLQAVHLLLAFPLFVVVVGVDPRWLLHSLRQHSKAFQDKTEEDDSSEEERTHWQSTPLNYLEKIFQIPFTLWPMGESGFGKMVDTLTEPPKSQKPNETPAAETVMVSAVSAGVAAAPETKTAVANVPKQADVAPEITTVTPATVVEKSWRQRLADRLRKMWSFTARPDSQPEAQKEAPASAEQVISEPPLTKSDAEQEKGSTAIVIKPSNGEVAQTVTELIDPHPEHLQIKTWERDFMKKLHQLIPSPRATKRFVNVYRLIRASVDLDEKLALDEFTGDAEQGKYRAVLLLLAVLTGYPDQATEILRDLLENEHPETWWEFVDSLKQRAEKRKTLRAKQATAGGDGPANAAGGKVESDEDVAAKTEAGQSQLKPNDEQAEENGRASALSDAETERWEQLLEKLDHLRGEIGANEPCDDFVDWAPKVARYSFQSGRVLLARNVESSRIFPA